MSIIKRDGSKEDFSETKYRSFVNWLTSDLHVSPELLYNELTIPVKDTPVDDLLKDIEDTAEKLANRINLDWFIVSGRAASLSLIKRHRANGFDLLSPNRSGYADFLASQIHSLKREDIDSSWGELIAVAQSYIQDEYNLTINRVRMTTQRSSHLYNGIPETVSLSYLRQAVDGSQYPKGTFDPEVALELLIGLMSTAYTNATPMANQAGLEFRSTGSCTLLTIDDDSRGIGAAHAELMLHSKHGSGNGLDWSRVAGAGRYIKTTNGVSNGVKPFLRISEAVLGAFNQGGGKGGKARIGAGVVTFPWWHIDCEELVYLKNTKGSAEERIRGLKYAMTTNDYFYEACNNNDNVFQFCPSTARKYFGDDRLIDEPLNFGDNYDDLVLACEAGVIEGTMIPARTIMGWFIENFSDNGHVYETNLSNINRQNILNESVTASNLCVTGDTLLLTDKGNLPIKSLADQTVNAWNGDKFSPTPIFRTSESQKILTVNLSGFKSIEATPYHRWEVLDGYSNTKIVTTAELVEGDKIVKSNVSECVTHGTEKLPLAYESGFLAADGTSHSKGNKIYLYEDKRAMKKFFTGYYNSSVTGTGNQERDNLFYGEGVLASKDFVPDVSYTLDSRLKWLAGYLDGDGTLTNNQGSESIQAVSINFRFLTKLQNLLLELGVDSKILPHADSGYRAMPLNDGSGKLGKYFTKASRRLVVPGSELGKLIALGYSANRVQPTARTYQRSAIQFPKVLSVIDEGKQAETFCGTEPDNNQLVFNGIRTMNCTEVMIPSRRNSEAGTAHTGLCFLNSTNMDWYHTTEPSVRARMVALQVRTLDNQIETDFYPVPHTTYEYAQANRFIGVGMSNVATLLAREGLTWDSQESLEFMDKLTEDWSYDILRASCDLAKERGPAPNWKNTKWAHGYLPYDLCNSEAAKLTKHVPDEARWIQLSEDIQEHGIRNLLNMAIAPTASSGASAGLTEGPNPVERLMINRTVEPVVKAAASMDKAILNQMQLAWDVPDEWIIKHAAVRQKWLDQGQSISLYAKGSSFSMKESYRIRELANRLGVKSIYYVKFQKVDDDICESCS